MIYWYAKKLSNIIKSRLIAEKITREIKHQRVYAQLCIITIIISTLQYVICYNILFQQLHYRYKYLYKIYHFIWTALQIIAKVVSPVTRHTQRSTPHTYTSIEWPRRSLNTKIFIQNCTHSLTWSKIFHIHWLSQNLHIKFYIDATRWLRSLDVSLIIP